MNFFPWLGGRSRIVKQYNDFFPSFYDIKGYIEPFLGGGNVFFYVMYNYWNDLEGKPIYISDINKGLINCYRIVRDNLDELIPLLLKHQRLDNEFKEEYYDNIKNGWNERDDNDRIEHAANFIYLVTRSYGNKWNVNKEGKMNSSYNHNSNVVIVNKNIYQCSKILNRQNIKIECMSFEKILEIKDIENFFVQLDPPFYGCFDQYRQDWHYHRPNLYLIFRELDRRGCKVMMSNSDYYLVYDLFRDYYINKIQTNRTSKSWKNDEEINDGDDKLPELELIITNYRYTKRQKSIDEAWQL